MMQTLNRSNNNENSSVIGPCLIVQPRHEASHRKRHWEGDGDRWQSNTDSTCEQRECCLQRPLQRAEPIAGTSILSVCALNSNSKFVRMYFKPNLSYLPSKALYHLSLYLIAFWTIYMHKGTTKAAEFFTIVFAIIRKLEQDPVFNL